MGNTVFFCLDVRADYSPEEQGNVRKYALGSQVIYNSKSARKHLERAGSHLDRVASDSLRDKAAGLARGSLSLVMARMSLNISIASLGRGHHIECKDLEELLEAEDTVRTACKGVTRYLEVAGTFDGSEVVIDYENGEERVHITQDAIPLLEYASSPAAASSLALPPSNGAEAMGRKLNRLYSVGRDYWLKLEQKLIASAKLKGLILSGGIVRLLCGVAGLLIVVLFVEIL